MNPLSMYGAITQGGTSDESGGSRGRSGRAHLSPGAGARITRWWFLKETPPHLQPSWEMLRNGNGLGSHTFFNRMLSLPVRWLNCAGTRPMCIEACSTREQRSCCCSRRSPRHRHSPSTPPRTYGLRPPFVRRLPPTTNENERKRYWSGEPIDFRTPSDGLQLFLLMVFPIAGLRDPDIFRKAVRRLTLLDDPREVESDPELLNRAAAIVDELLATSPPPPAGPARSELIEILRAATKS